MGARFGRVYGYGRTTARLEHSITFGSLRG